MKICKNETFESINKKLYKLKKKWYSDSIQKEWKIIKKNIPLKYIKSYLEYYKKDNILKLYNEIKFYHDCKLSLKKTSLKKKSTLNDTNYKLLNEKKLLLEKMLKQKINLQSNVINTEKKDKKGDEIKIKIKIDKPTYINKNNLRNKMDYGQNKNSDNLDVIRKNKKYDKSKLLIFINKYNYKYC